MGKGLSGLVGWGPALARAAREARARTAGALVKARLGAAPRRDHLISEAVRLASLPGLGATLVEGVFAISHSAYGSEGLRAIAQAALERLPAGVRARDALFLGAFRALYPSAPGAALELGDALGSELRDPRVVQELARCHRRVGAILRPLELLAPLELGGRGLREREELRQQAEILRHGVPFGPPARRSWEPAAGRVLYFANQSLPHHQSGYAIRTHWLIRALASRGWDVAAYTRFGYPNDRYDFLGRELADPQAEVDGIVYRFAPARRGFGALDVASYQEVSVATLLRQAGEARPSIIHAASNYTCGLAGAEAARRLGIPMIYEVRGLWHLTRASRQPEYEGSDHYQMIERLEAQAAASADHVFAITSAVGDVLVDRGVPREKISVLPNAVDIGEFSPRVRDRDNEARWSLEGCVVLGYAGAFKAYEGLDYLIHAAARLRTRVSTKFRVLLVGDGDVRRELEALAKKLRVEDLVVFAGRQPHREIQRIYSVMDVAVFPRRGDRVCEVVSPLKPLEAMASRKAVVASDVGALAEIVRHERTGLLHRKDDVASLSDELERLLSDAALRRFLAEAACSWVRDNRSWSQAAEQVGDVYQTLLRR